MTLSILRSQTDQTVLIHIFFVYNNHSDRNTQKLFQFLLEHACVPYFEMLEQWLYRGIIRDHYAEFMIEENRELQKESLTTEFNDSYWEQRYTIRTQHLPSFLERVAKKILLTGKYLNVIHESQKKVICPFAEKIFYTSQEREYVEKIEKAFHFASKQLMDLIIMDENLLPRLHSLKHYFLLGHGDFFVHFVDIAEDELQKNISSISKMKLESLLELALRMSVAVNDPYKEDLTLELMPNNLPGYLAQISRLATGSAETLLEGGKFARRQNPLGMEALTLDYRIGWPLSLIINKRTLTKYQILFRHLFYCKYVERTLCNAWIRNKFTKELLLGSSFTAIFVLRQRMLHFLQSFEYYMMFEVIEQNFHIMEQKIRELSKDRDATLDDIMSTHHNFLDTCLKACLLSTHNKDTVMLFKVCMD